MTFEELKAEAKKQGYNLIKQSEPIPLKPCVCGAKRSVHKFYNDIGVVYFCRKCGKYAVAAKKDKEARQNWNIFIAKTEVRE